MAKHFDTQQVTRPSTQPHTCNFCNRSLGHHSKRAVAKDAVGHFIDKFRHHHHHHHHEHYRHNGEDKPDAYLTVPILHDSPNSDTESVKSSKSSLKGKRLSGTASLLAGETKLISRYPSSSFSSDDSTDDGNSLFPPDLFAEDESTPVIPAIVEPTPLEDEVVDVNESLFSSQPDQEPTNDELEVFPEVAESLFPILPSQISLDMDIENVTASDSPPPPSSTTLESVTATPSIDPHTIPLPPSRPASPVLQPVLDPAESTPEAFWLNDTMTRPSWFSYVSGLVAPAVSLLKYYAISVLSYGALAMLTSCVPAMQDTQADYDVRLPFAYRQL